MKPKPKPKLRTPRIKIETARFASEQEEADWWDQHPDVIEDAIVRAEAAGAVTVERDARRLTKPTNIRLYAEDLEAARKIAHRKGLKLQTYIKMVLHEALQREQRES